MEKSERDGRAKDKKIADLQTENTSLRGQIRSLTAQIDQIKAELWEKINNLTDKLRGAYESLTNVVKAVGMLKYDREKDQNGFNIADFSELTRSEITQIKKTLQALIRQYDIVEYAQLMDFLQDEEMNVEYEVASNNTLFFDRYIGSRRHAPRIPKCDPKTGEVIEKKES